MGWSLEQFQQKAQVWLSNSRGYKMNRDCIKSGELQYKLKVEEMWPACFAACGGPSDPVMPPPTQTCSARSSSEAQPEAKPVISSSAAAPVQRREMAKLPATAIAKTATSSKPSSKKPAKKVLSVFDELKERQDASGPFTDQNFHKNQSIYFDMQDGSHYVTVGRCSEH